MQKSAKPKSLLHWFRLLLVLPTASLSFVVTGILIGIVFYFLPDGASDWWIIPFVPFFLSWFTASLFLLFGTLMAPAEKTKILWLLYSVGVIFVLLCTLIVSAIDFSGARVPPDFNALTKKATWLMALSTCGGGLITALFLHKYFGRDKVD